MSVALAFLLACLGTAPSSSSDGGWSVDDLPVGTGEVLMSGAEVLFVRYPETAQPEALMRRWYVAIVAQGWNCTEPVAVTGQGYLSHCTQMRQRPKALTVSRLPGQVLVAMGNQHFDESSHSRGAF